jgi:hypothetical protein
MYIEQGLAMTVYDDRTRLKQPDKPEARAGVLGEMVVNIQRVETMMTKKDDTKPEAADIGYGCLGVMFVQKETTMGKTRSQRAPMVSLGARGWPTKGLHCLGL